MKKIDLPAMPFYIGDWEKDPGVQCLSWEEKGIWFKLICLMWESKERGYLRIGNIIPDIFMLEKVLNLDNQRLTKIFERFKSLNLYSTREKDNCLYSRKILHILEISEKRKNAGIKGGNPKLKKKIRITKGKPLGYPKAEDEDENEIEDINDFEIEYRNKEEKEVINRFIEYRKEIKKPYKSEKSINQFIINLRKMGNNNLDTMKEIVNHSIANGWQGIFSLEEKRNYKPRFGRQEVSRAEIIKNMEKTEELLNAH